jgi:acyl-CoA synthetase (AMP-forming)/AMP-acid ligase II
MTDLDPRTALTLGDLMRRRATRSPDGQYFDLYDETVTYGRLWAQSARYAAGLVQAGVRAGDKVCLIYPTCAEFFYTFFGCVRLGAIPVPLYPTLGVDATASPTSSTATPRPRPTTRPVPTTSRSCSTPPAAPGSRAASC